MPQVEARQRAPARSCSSAILLVLDAGIWLVAEAIGVMTWLGLVPHVLRHWQTPTIGASFVLTVATGLLALLAATLAFSERAS